MVEELAAKGAVEPLHPPGRSRRGRLRADRPDHRRLPADAGPAPGRAGDRMAHGTAATRDHYLRLDSNDCSVHPAVIGRRSSPTLSGFGCSATAPVADHERVRAWHQTISDPEHLAAARALRRQRVGVLHPVVAPSAEPRYRFAVWTTTTPHSASTPAWTLPVSSGAPAPTAATPMVGWRDDPDPTGGPGEHRRDP